MDAEKNQAARLDSILSTMTPLQRAVFIARGEGMAEGYKLGRADAQAVQPPETVRAGA